MYKKSQIIMLPTNTNNVLVSDKKHLVLNDNNLFNPFKNEYYHLYVLSDDEIKKGDFVYSILTHKIEVIQDVRTEVCFAHKKIIATTDKSLSIENAVKKANESDCEIGSTGWIKIKESNLLPQIPQIPQSFIEYYVSEYNKNNQIKEVMVEYEPANIGQEIIQIGVGDEFVTSWKLKINPDNTINIKPVKESWNRKEVIELLKTGMIHSFKIGNKLFKDFDSTHKIYPHRNPNFYEDKMKKHCEFDNWIGQNL